ncbi:MAG: stage III sporulation protein AB [Lachnospiraceae bacterium]|nr:stage III sporulation protein AB [Lachnospiraceae bacterium]
MPKLTGCLLVTMGCIGFAGSICRDTARRLLLMKRIRNIYENLKYYIAYQKTTVPEALFQLSQKEEAPLAEAFGAVYRECYEDGGDFSGLWRFHMERALEKTPLTVKEKELFYAFPSCLGFMEENAQAAAVDNLLREVERCVEALEAERKNKDRVVMSLGAAFGVLLSILLL